MPIAGETKLAPGMCAGVKVGTGNVHQLMNPGSEEAHYFEVGNRTAGDSVSYPDDDLQLVMTEDGKPQFQHKDETPY